jgi:hypothetical protein
MSVLGKLMNENEENEGSDIPPGSLPKKIPKDYFIKGFRRHLVSLGLTPKAVAEIEAGMDNYINEFKRRQNVALTLSLVVAPFAGTGIVAISCELSRPALPAVVPSAMIW